MWLNQPPPLHPLTPRIPIKPDMETLLAVLPVRKHKSKYFLFVFAFTLKLLLLLFSSHHGCEAFVGREWLMGGDFSGRVRVEATVEHEQDVGKNC